jgi:hypothetical protein
VFGIPEGLCQHVPLFVRNELTLLNLLECFHKFILGFSNSRRCNSLPCLFVNVSTMIIKPISCPPGQLLCS